MAEICFEAAVRDAQASGEWTTVITLYIEAAIGAAEAFNLTHAYIHALEAGDVRVEALKKQLVALGAEVADDPNASPKSLGAHAKPAN